MTQIRQDAWKEREDKQLAEIVLQFIQRGKTQIEAFREAAIHLQRTPAACGFRWNANLRKQYAAELEQIRNNPAIVTESTVNNINSDTVQLIQKLMKKIQLLDLDATTEKAEIIKLKAENNYLKKQVKRYEEGWQEMNQLWKWIKSEKEANNRGDLG